jgi:hypothetical protein
LKRVWKFHVRHSQLIEMPVGAEIIYCANQPGLGPHLWVLVDPDAPREYRSLHVVGTGHPVPEGGKHVGSWIDDPFVWHVFEVGP